MSRALLLGAVAALALALPAFAETVAITNAKIETAGAAGEIANGVVVIKDGRIAAVGAGIKAPAGARIVDAAGKVVTPGLIAASTNLTVAEVDGVKETRDDSGGGKLGAAFDVPRRRPHRRRGGQGGDAGPHRRLHQPHRRRGGRGEGDAGR